MNGDYPPVAFHFKVVISGSSEMSDTSFQEVSGISAQMETEDVAEGGENRYVHRLPVRVKHPMLTLKRGIVADSSQLLVWCKSVLEGDSISPIVPRTVQVILLDEEALPKCSWSFANAYPVNWEVEGFNSMKNEVAIEKLELSYTYSERVI